MEKNDDITDDLPKGFLKILGGLLGGITGSLVLFLLFLLGSSINSEFLNFQENINVSPITIFFLMVLVFLALTISNIFSVWWIALSNKKRYRKKASIIYQIFIFNLVFFVIFAPIYLLVGSIQSENVFNLIILHLLLASSGSFLILEIVTYYQRSLLFIYQAFISFALSSALLFFLNGQIVSPIIPIFIAFPVAWFNLIIVSFLSEKIYLWIAKIYDKDFLAPNTEYAEDYGIAPPQKTKPEKPQNQDLDGADFLNKTD